MHFVAPSRNLGLVTGASVMGAVFAHASGAIDVATARAEAIAVGMRTTFGLAAALIVGALVIATASQARAMRAPLPGRVPAPRENG